ncbi:MAG: cysteine desulfurase [Ignavibacteriaceae bacterium]|nr:cysteine desulfurase [Ignavibacteriaceae bacterium]
MESEILTSEIKTSAPDFSKIRENFPTLHQTVKGRQLVYLDSAATTHKPVQVIEKIDHYYRLQNSNIHRGVHYLSQLATEEYENARIKVKNFINASSEKEIVFVKGTTEGVNLVASSYGNRFINEGDEIIITHMEHHSNIVPWQLLCERKGAVLRVIPINDRGELIMEEYKKLLNEKTKMVAVVHASNTLGTENPVKEIIEEAHKYNVPVLIDGAQAVQHFEVDVRALDADFYTFSGHKLYGPTGIGVLYGKKELLEKMPPYQGGGDMISYVSFERTTYNELPYKFEAGTPHIAGGIGLGYAIDYVKGVGLQAIKQHEAALLDYANKKLLGIPGLTPIGTAEKKSSVFSFVLENIHPHDIGTILDVEGVAVRTGHLCTQPLMRRFDVPAVARASFGMYNNTDDIDALAEAILKVFKVFG